jgi:hypothetical protein
MDQINHDIFRPIFNLLNIENLANNNENYVDISSDINKVEMTEKIIHSQEIEMVILRGVKANILETVVALQNVYNDTSKNDLFVL